MSTRTERLDRLVIQSPCRTSWEAMDESGSGRFCPRCNKHVHDLAAMEAREVEALVEATRGRFCARLTRDRAGRLVLRPPAPPPAALPDTARRASPAAAAVVGALVGLSGAAWAGVPPPAEPVAPAQATAAPAAPAGTSGPAAPPAAAPPETPETTRPARDRAAGGGIAGRILDEDGAGLPGATVVVREADQREWSTATGADGSFAFEGLPAGVYTVEAQREYFEFTPEPNLVLQPGGRREIALIGEGDTITVGGAAAGPEPLLYAYRESSLAVIATVGPSVTLREPSQGSSGRAIRTELQVAAVLKGTLRGSTVQVDRTEYPDDEPSPAAGETVLVFLKPAEGRAVRRAPVYATVDLFEGLRQLPADALRAYRHRIEALARLGEEPRADELLEWLVATAEDEHTRHETVGKLHGALSSLAFREEKWARRRAQPGRAEELDPQAEADRLLAQAGAPGGEVEPAVLGALLTPAHRKRLSRALLATERLTPADFSLFHLVRPWAGEAALRWLAERLAGDVEPDYVARQAMDHLAMEIADDGLQKLLDQADYESEAAYGAYKDEAAEPDEVRYQRFRARVEAIEHQLRRDFLRALGNRP